jgi:hypothetical protein
MTPARSIVSEDNDQVRVTTWTGHDVVSAADREAAFVEIELKRWGPPEPRRV